MSETLTTDNPVIQKKQAKLPKKETDTRELPQAERPPTTVPIAMDEPTPHGHNTMTPDVHGVRQLEKTYADALAFAEEPVTIIIHASTERFASQTTDLVCNNGTKAEMLINDRWIQVGYLPRGKEFTTKRKYVEQLARAKKEQIATKVLERDGEDPQNLLERMITHQMAFTMLKDTNPKGPEWLCNLMQQTA